jgi:hypothetical protein
MLMAKAGRPRKIGPRFPSGDLKPQGEAISPTQWERIRTTIAKAANEPMLASEIGRLSFAKQLTDAQASAAFRVQAIYTTFDVSRGYGSVGGVDPDRSFGRGYDDDIVDMADIDKLDETDPLRKKMLAARAARDAFLELQDAFKVLNRDERKLLEDIVVSGRMAMPGELDDLRALLEAIGKWFDNAGARKKMKKVAKLQRALGVKKAPENPVSRVTLRLPAIDELVLRKVLETLRPDLELHQLAKVMSTAGVLREREMERRKKPAPRQDGLPTSRLDLVKVKLSARPTLTLPQKETAAGTSTAVKSEGV